MKLSKKKMVLMSFMLFSLFFGAGTVSYTHPETAHKIMEALKLAFTDGKRYVADPRAMKPTVEQLLSKDYAAKRRALIGSTALEPRPGTPYCGDTVYLNAADGDGNMISYIPVSYTHLDVYKRQQYRQVVGQNGIPTYRLYPFS